MTTRYLLDTDVASGIVRPNPSLPLLRRVAVVPQVDLFTSAITIGELVYGAARRERSGLEARIEQFITTVPVVSFDAVAAIHYGRLRAHLERSGRRLDDPDLRIASIALAHEMVLVTGNVRHFQRVPALTIENWLA